MSVTAKPIRIALIQSDCVDEYFEALRKLESVDCHAVVPNDRSDPALQGLADPNSIVGLEQLFENAADRFDIAVVDSTLPMRAEIARRLAEVGKPSCLNFPPASQASEWNELSAVFQRTGVPWMVANPWRCHAYLNTIQQSLESNQLGRPGLLRLHHWARRPTISRLDQVGIVTLAATQLDVACWLFGGRPTSVYAVALPQSSPSSDREMDERTGGLQIHLGFADGGMAQLGCVVAPHCQPYSMVTLVGSQGAAYADDHHNMNLLIGERNESLLVEQRADRIARLLDTVSDCFGEFDDRRVCTPAELTVVYQVAQVVAESLENGKAGVWDGERYEFS